MINLKKSLVIALCGTIIVSSLAGCKNSSTDKNSESPVSKEDLFPDHYTRSTDKVNFDIDLEVMDDFDPNNFTNAKVKGRTYTDVDKVYELYVDGKDVSEVYETSPGDEGGINGKTYIMSDNEIVTAGTNFSMSTEKSYTYTRARRFSEKGASKDEFDFASSTDCINDVKNILESVDYDVTDVAFDWFSSSGEEYRLYEEEAIANETIESAKINQNSWSSDDNAYEIYGWQTYKGLPVYPLIMTTRMTRCLETYEKANVSAVCTKDGVLNIYASPLYDLKETDKNIEFLSFEEIADSLVNRYENLLDENSYEVIRAKLALRIFYDEKGKYDSEPIWYFEVIDSNSNFEIVLYNAITGEEVYMP